mgnify:CR=1 FL=1
MNIYVAGFFDTRYRLRPYADQMWHKGHSVVSSWLNETQKPDLMSKEIFWKKLAIKDLAEIKQADMIIVDTLDITPRGGREVEYGFALAHFQTKHCWIVGPVRNVFHELADKRFDNWDDCLIDIPNVTNNPVNPIVEIVNGDPF